jgi:hypothetical protein
MMAEARTFDKAPPPGLSRDGIFGQYGKDGLELCEGEGAGIPD